MYALDHVTIAIRRLHRRSIITKLEILYLQRHVMPRLHYKQPAVYAGGFRAVTPELRRNAMRALACRDPEYFSELARNSAHRIGHTAFLVDAQVGVPGVPSGCCGVFGFPVEIPVSLYEIREAVDYAFALRGDIDLSQACKDRAFAKAGGACSMCGRSTSECGSLWVRSMIMHRGVDASVSMYDRKWDDPLAVAMCRGCFNAWQRYADDLGSLREEAGFGDMSNFDRIVQGLYVKPEDPYWFFRDPVLGNDARRFFDYARSYCRASVFGHA